MEQIIAEIYLLEDVLTYFQFQISSNLEKISEVEENTSEFAQRHSENLETVKQFAISSLTPIIESLPLKKRDLNELANKISKSAWLRMVTNSRRKAHVRKIKAGFKRLMLFD